MTKTALSLSFLISLSAFAKDTAARIELKKMYEHHCRESSDIYEHIPVLKQLSLECSSVAEIGIRGMVSTWGVLEGLAENSMSKKSYLGIDLANPPASSLNLAKKLSQANNINFQFWKINDMNIDINKFENVDMLFIDSLHTYCHLTYELEKFCNKVNKYISMHDTSAPWGTEDDNQYHGDFSEYPDHYDKNKRGLWAAVEDFLQRHPEWTLYERRFNNHGFTILKRIK